ncbi:hypothetical protein B0J13DRAFT_615663 [Dactylonectria estremocensis]|uniref:Extracellular matrix protein n=1 Tax=Dactylonectria estremocensis TaxID=1079267 RepID=A0A9P9JLF4_9HYPO|nr:hypothetical protein B0J13DRAFT_615663 [Dactylonectria estremocensis]
MKYSVAYIATLASAVSAAKFLNSNWDVVIGTPFEIKFDGCADGCTIVLQNGISTDLSDVETLTAEAKDGSFTWTPSKLPTDEYNFKISENSDPTEVNYSSQFVIEGDVEATSSAETSTAVSTSAAESTSAESTSSAESTEATTLTTLSTAVTTTEVETTFSTPAATHNGTTPGVSTDASSTKTKGSSSTATEDASSTATETSASTTVPDSGATRMTSSIALIAGAVMAMVYLN